MAADGDGAAALQMQRSFSVDEGELDEFNRERFRQLTVDHASPRRAHERREHDEGGGDEEEEEEQEEEGPFYKVGLLTKLGGSVKNWLERGFALRRDYRLLHYFRTAEDFQLFAGDSQKHASKVAGTINLHGAAMFAANYVEFGNCVEITTSRDVGFRHYYLYARTRTELASWITALTECGVQFVTPSAVTPEVQAVTHPDSPVPVYGMQGFVEKRGGFNKAFKLRFFRLEWSDQLQEHVLGYYVRFDDAKPKGTVRLTGAEVADAPADARPEDEPERQWEIRTPSRTYVLRCSLPEKRLWARVLGRFLAHPERPPPEVTVVDTEAEAAEAEAKAAAAAAPPAAAADEDVPAADGGGAAAAASASSVSVSPATGGRLDKFGSSGAEGARHVWVERDRLFWDECEGAEARRPTDDRSVKLAAVLLVSMGKTTDNFSHAEAGAADEARCFSVVTAERSIDFEAPTAGERDAWVAALRHLVRTL